MISSGGALRHCQRGRVSTQLQAAEPDLRSSSRKCSSSSHHLPVRVSDAFCTLQPNTSAGFPDLSIEFAENRTAAPPAAGVSCGVRRRVSRGESAPIMRNCRRRRRYRRSHRRVALRQRHDVWVYERSDIVGGHAHAATLRRDDTTIGVDTAFVMFNPDTYPTFTRLLAYLGVDSWRAPTSFSCHIADRSGRVYATAAAFERLHPTGCRPISGGWCSTRSASTGKRLRTPTAAARG